MATKLSTGAKYLLQLAQTANLADFLKEAKIFFKSSDVQRDLFERDNHSYPKKYELSETYQNLADEFGKTPLIAKLNKLSWADMIIAMYELPIFWGTVPMKLFREKLANLKGTGEQVMVPLVQKIIENPTYKEGWTEVFWKSFFAEWVVYPRVEHESAITKLVDTFETFLKTNKDEALIYKCCEAYRKFFHAFAKVVVNIAALAENADVILKPACELTQFHPAFCKLVFYKNSDKISEYFLKEVQVGYLKRLQGDSFATWPMFEAGYSAITHVIVCGKRCGRLKQVSEYVVTVEIFGKRLEEWNAKNRFHDKEYCSLSEASKHLQQRSAVNFVSEALKANWTYFVSRNPMTDTNGDEVVKLQAKYFVPERNKQFEKITADNFRLCLSYISQMDIAMKDKEWNRDAVIKYITISDAWKQYPIETVIDLYYKYKSMVMYESILQRPADELPNEWMREKHLYQLCHKAFAKEGHSHTRIYG